MGHSQHTSAIFQTSSDMEYRFAYKWVFSSRTVNENIGAMIVSVSVVEVLNIGTSGPFKYIYGVRKERRYYFQKQCLPESSDTPVGSRSIFWNDRGLRLAMQHLSFRTPKRMGHILTCDNV